jgi:hypothetical protein
MGIARSTFYDEPTAAEDDTAIVEAIAAICDEFEAYGWQELLCERIQLRCTKRVGSWAGLRDLWRCTALSKLAGFHFGPCR